MASILKTQKKIDSARQRAEDLKKELKEIERKIQQSSGRLIGLAERLCGRTVLYLLQQGTPVTPGSITTQARTLAGKFDQDALVRLSEQLEAIPTKSERIGKVTLDPTVRFALSENLRNSPVIEPVEYKIATLDPAPTGDFFETSPQIHQDNLTTLIEGEGPISRELIHRRLREAWKLAQAHPAVKDNINTQLDALNKDTLLSGDGESFWSTNSEIRPRKRSKQFRESHGSDTVPSVELRAAVVQSLLREAAITSEIVATACDLIGYETKSYGLRSRIMDELEKLYICGEVIIL